MQNIKRYRITDLQREKARDEVQSFLLGRKEVIFAYIHGSFLQNLFRDIDLAIYVDETLKREDALHLELKMEMELEEITGFPSDVRVLNHAPLTFKFNVLKDGNLLMTRNEDIRADFESLSLREYHDFNFYRKRYMKEVFGFEV